MKDALLLGPLGAFIPLIKEKYGTRLLLKYPKEAFPQKFLKDWLKTIKIQPYKTDKDILLPGRGLGSPPSTPPGRGLGSPPLFLSVPAPVSCFPWEVVRAGTLKNYSASVDTRAGSDRTRIDE